MGDSTGRFWLGRIDEPVIMCAKMKEASVDRERQALEVDRNYDAFVRILSVILPDHRDQLALMRDGEIVGYYDTPHDALTAAGVRFADGIFSIQEVTDEPIDLGFWSHVRH